MSRIRLHVDHPLGQGQMVPLSRDQAHYLGHVMRQRTGSKVLVFNGLDGEWRAEISELGKRGGTLVAEDRTAPQRDPPDLWLLFAPIKKARTDFIVEKAAELGTRRAQPVHTLYTNAERIRRDRLQAHAIEAAEQCGGTFVPEVAELRKLEAVLDDWPTDRQLLFCDEAAVDEPFGGLGDRPRGPWAILIGPEGGFAEAERTRLAEMPQAHRISLGPRILRADTAAVAALTLWQAALGDWS
ncbi:MAG: 16S rRNA (uracil(1498)-N(3))-methyltransferase [Pseudomonadota bacterium]